MRAEHIPGPGDRFIETNPEFNRVATHRAILVPSTGHMPVETLQRLLELAKDGAMLLFTDALPADVPGFGQLEERRVRLRTTIDSLVFFPNPAGFREANIGEGRILVGPWSALIAASEVCREPMADVGLRFIRRSTGQGEIYFIANQTAQPVEGWIPLGRPAQGALLMSPRRGGTAVAALRQNHGVAEIYIQQAPGESGFIRAYPQGAAPGNPVRYMHPAGEPIVLGGDWKVNALRGGPELPPAFMAHGFGSWTTQGGEWECFGGTARYEIQFTVPEDANADDWQLDLGDVRETARVFVNGTETDLVWALPMRTRIGPFLQQGVNTLALEVTNLAANRIRDLDQRKVEWKKFHEINFVNIFYQPFDAAAWPLAPSGLLGPVTLMPLRTFTPP